MPGRQYIAIDLKSFYASVECVERGLDPLTTHLVVADESRTEKTICLAVSPSLKAYGIPGRARLFEVVQKMREVNAARRSRLQGAAFSGSSHEADRLEQDSSLEAAYVTAVPRMHLYMDYSNRIYSIYLQTIAPEDIYIYSIDEVFMDVTAYLRTYQMTAQQLCRKLIRDVYTQTGITATGGIGTNLYLAKVAMDLMAKHMKPDQEGVRIATLDEMNFRRYFWSHRPLTDFWRIGKGYARKLESRGLYTMGDIARCSLENEDILYSLFGINAGHLIDQAWGVNEVTISDIKSYKPRDSSLSTGQVLPGPYPFEKGKLIVKEMADTMAMDLLEKHLVADLMVLTVGYDIENLSDPRAKAQYKGEIVSDWYGRRTPRPAHGSTRLGQWTSSAGVIIEAVVRLYEKITDPHLTIRRVYLAAGHVRSEEAARQDEQFVQMDLFADYGVTEEKREQERRLQEAALEIRRRFGKNAIMKGMDLEEGATGRERRGQVGGHRG